MSLTNPENWPYIIIDLSAFGPDDREFHVCYCARNPLLDNDWWSFWWDLKIACEAITMKVGVYGRWYSSAVYVSGQYAPLFHEVEVDEVEVGEVSNGTTGTRVVRLPN